MGVECWTVVSCVNTVDCLDPFFWKITHFIVVVTPLLFELFKNCYSEKPPLLWKRLVNRVPVGLAEVGPGLADNSESKRHVLPAGLFSLLGRANLVALNIVDGSEPRAQAGMSNTLSAWANRNCPEWKQRNMSNILDFRNMLFCLPALFFLLLCFMLFWFYTHKKHNTENALMWSVK